LEHPGQVRIHSGALPLKTQGKIAKKYGNMAILRFSEVRIIAYKSESNILNPIRHSPAINLHLIAIFWLIYATLILGPQEGPGNGRD
jgi:hypothetical protein